MGEAVVCVLPSDVVGENAEAEEVDGEGAFGGGKGGGSATCGERAVCRTPSSMTETVRGKGRAEAMEAADSE